MWFFFLRKFDLISLYNISHGLILKLEIMKYIKHEIFPWSQISIRNRDGGGWLYWKHYPHSCMNWSFEWLIGYSGKFTQSLWRTHSMFFRGTQSTVAAVYKQWKFSVMRRYFPQNLYLILIILCLNTFWQY
jgi:hypothetical protein